MDDGRNGRFDGCEDRAGCWALDEDEKAGCENVGKNEWVCVWWTWWTAVGAETRV